MGLVNLHEINHVLASVRLKTECLLHYYCIYYVYFDCMIRTELQYPNEVHITKCDPQI